MYKVRDLEYKYDDGGAFVKIDSFEGDQASKCLVLGDSGSGKSTLIKLMSGLLTPDSGSIEICGRDIVSLTEKERDKFRGDQIGIIFQGNHLLATLTVFQNLALANYSAGKELDQDHIQFILEELEIRNLADRFPNSLSQGQKQRVAIGRSLVNNPSIILADEPSSSLDDANAGRVLDLLFKEAERLSATLVIATHDQRVKSKINNIFEIN